MTFVAVLSSTANTAVTWQVDGETGGDPTVGTISTSGLFTAPTLPPPSDEDVVITAVSQADSTMASISVAIQFANASVQGAYVFSVNGASGGSIVSTVGRFQANGSGGITDGVEDGNASSGSFANVDFTGTYNVGSDGRGSMAITSVFGTSVYDFVIVSLGQIQLIGFDDGDSLSGSALQQSSDALSLGALAGGWSFFLSGSAAGKTVVEAGRFTLDSAGNVTLGAEDYNSGAIVSSNATFTGNASSVSGGGRSTASFTGTLGTSTFSFYVASSNTLYLVDTNSGVLLAGSAYKQETGDFSNSSLSGTYVFLFAGANNLGDATAKIGEITAGGNGLFTGGLFDQNDNGTATLNQAMTGGTYSIASNGRGTASISSDAGTSSYALHLIDLGRVVFVETDSFGTTGGLATVQGGVFSNSSINGWYGLTSFGVVSSAGFESVGRASFLAGNLTAGIDEESQAGALASGVALSGTYSLASTGRGTAQLTGASGTSDLIFYVIDRNTVQFLEVDPSEVVAGSLDRQSQIGEWDY